MPAIAFTRSEETSKVRKQVRNPMPATCRRVSNGPPDAGGPTPFSTARELSQRPVHPHDEWDEWGNLRFYLSEGPVRRSASVAVYLLARGAQCGQPVAAYRLAKLLAEDAPEDIPILSDAALLASLAYQYLPEGDLRMKAGMLRDMLMGMLDAEEQELVLSRACSWPDC